jgi:hypothetical protein
MAPRLARPVDFISICVGVTVMALAVVASIN